MACYPPYAVVDCPWLGKMTRHSIIKQKLARLRTGGKPRLLDLFAGCGGLSLGFHAAGFRPVAAIENDACAAASYGRNFHPGQSEFAQPRDITTITPAALTAELGLGRPEEAFDIIVGGPPCQAFARVGRSKLREIAAHPEAFKKDPRASLYLNYLNSVEECAPLAVLMENVPDILNHGGQNLAEEICEVLSERGYIARYSLLNAAYYGVPQTRERMFLIAYRRELADEIRFPAPTHNVDLPPGYLHSRSVALRLVSAGGLLDSASGYLSAPSAGAGLPPAVTAKEALGDLPPIMEHLVGGLRRGARRLDKPVAYDPGGVITRYAAEMRSWPGFPAGPSLLDHVIRFLPRDYPLFARMAPGDQYPQAHRQAMAMLDERIAERKKAGEHFVPGTLRYRLLKKSMVPPYDVNKFPNKWRKMEPDRPARTLMAHLGKDSYSHIHYDSAQARTISVREAARLQSFPDGFAFAGTMNPAFRQIGNAVPPKLSRAIADIMYATIMSQLGFGASGMLREMKRG